MATRRFSLESNRTRSRHAILPVCAARVLVVENDFDPCTRRIWHLISILGVKEAVGRSVVRKHWRQIHNGEVVVILGRATFGIAVHSGVAIALMASYGSEMPASAAQVLASASVYEKEKQSTVERSVLFRNSAQ